MPRLGVVKSINSFAQIPFQFFSLPSFPASSQVSVWWFSRGFHCYISCPDLVRDDGRLLHWIKWAVSDFAVVFFFFRVSLFWFELGCIFSSVCYKVWFFLQGGYQLWFSHGSWGLRSSDRKNRASGGHWDLVHLLLRSGLEICGRFGQSLGRCEPAGATWDTGNGGAWWLSLLQGAQWTQSLGAWRWTVGLWAWPRHARRRRRRLHGPRRQRWLLQWPWWPRAWNWSGPVWSLRQYGVWSLRRYGETRPHRQQEWSWGDEQRPEFQSEPRKRLESGGWQEQEQKPKWEQEPQPEQELVAKPQWQPEQEQEQEPQPKPQLWWVAGGTEPQPGCSRRGCPAASIWVRRAPPSVRPWWGCAAWAWAAAAADWVWRCSSAFWSWRRLCRFPSPWGGCSGTRAGVTFQSWADHPGDVPHVSWGQCCFIPHWWARQGAAGASDIEAGSLGKPAGNLAEWLLAWGSGEEEVSGLFVLARLKQRCGEWATARRGRFFFSAAMAVASGIPCLRICLLFEAEGMGYKGINSLPYSLLGFRGVWSTDLAMELINIY